MILRTADGQTMSDQIGRFDATSGSWLISCCPAPEREVCGELGLFFGLRREAAPSEDPSLRPESRRVFRSARLVDVEHAALGRLAER